LSRKEAELIHETPVSTVENPRKRQHGFLARKSTRNGHATLRKRIEKFGIQRGLNVK
jgi:ribosomal protein L34